MITVTAEGAAPVEIPLRVRVHAWRLGGLADFVTHNNLWQSVDSIALYYRVPLWSQRHWELMEQSFALLGRAGSKLVNVLVAEQTQFGNDRGMIHWVRRADGSFEHDFSIFDRYLQLAQKHLDANYYQYRPFLNDFNQTRHTDLVPVVGVHIEPFGPTRPSTRPWPSCPMAPAWPSPMTR